MSSYGSFVVIATAVLAFIKTGDALQCWDCSSDAYGLCRDTFNGSDFSRITTLQYAATNSPRLITCTGPPNYNQGFGGYGGNNNPSSYNSYGHQRQVCVKRVETDRRYQRTTYFRGCQTLNNDERVGSCPSSTSYGDLTVDFCEFCDTNQCNGAQGLQKNAFWLGLIPIGVALMLRK